jgi:hypothetical protein
MAPLVLIVLLVLTGCALLVAAVFMMFGLAGAVMASALVCFGLAVLIARGGAAGGGVKSDG